jgi:hypothetical protein
MVVQANNIYIIHTSKEWLKINYPKRLESILIIFSVNCNSYLSACWVLGSAEKLLHTETLSIFNKKCGEGCHVTINDRSKMYTKFCGIGDCKKTVIMARLDNKGIPIRLNQLYKSRVTPKLGFERREGYVAKLTPAEEITHILNRSYCIPVGKKKQI